MSTRKKITTFVSMALLVISHASLGASKSEVMHALLRHLPHATHNLWILEKARGDIAETGVFSDGGILSPDGRWYAIRPGLGPYNMEGRITLGNVQSRQEAIIPSPEDAGVPWSSPVWSPDSLLLAYVTLRGLGAPDHAAIMIYQMNTGQSVELLRLKGRIRSTRFWDGGSKMLFFWETRTYEEVQGGPTLSVPSVSPVFRGKWMILDLMHKVVSVYAEDIPCDHSTWPLQSPDRRHIAYTYGNATFVYDAEQDQATCVLPSCYLYSMAWTPDGRFLVGMLHRPSRNPLQKTRLLFSDSIKYVFEGWAYDMTTSETITMKVTDRLREALLVWPR